MSIVLDGSNGIQTPAGSVSNPSLRSSDTDTGVYFPSSNTIAVTIDGSQKVLVNSDGSTFNNDVTLNAQSDLRFADADSSNYIAFQAPSTISSNFTLTLPTGDGIANQALVTDGSGNLSFANVASEVDPPLPNILMLAGM